MKDDVVKVNDFGWHMSVFFIKHRLQWFLVGAFFLLIAGCVASQKTSDIGFEIASNPGDALCTLHYQKEEKLGAAITVLGKTPLRRLVPLYQGTGMWLKVEKRGYSPLVIQLVPGRAVKLDLNLEKIDMSVCSSDRFHEGFTPDRIGLVMPKIKVIARGTFENEISENENQRIGELFLSVAGKVLERSHSVVPLKGVIFGSQPFRALWRDAGTAMEIVDPVRLSYFRCPACLETASGRKDAGRIGLKYSTNSVLLISGSIDYEKGSYTAAKAGLHTLGTAASFAGGYGSALSNNQSTFTYTIYIPQTVQGTILKAVLVDTATGEILWINKGIWDLGRFSDTGQVQKVVKELLDGFQGHNSEK